MKEKGFVRYLGTLEIRDRKNGELLLVQKNLITNDGLAAAMFQLGDGGDPLTDACIGTGSTAAQNTDSDLEAEVDNQEPVFTQVTTVVTDDTAQFVSVHTGGAGGWSVREYGIKTTMGNLFNRVVFAAITLAEGNELEFTYKVQAQRVA
jgi:hypothetical protein